MNADNTTHHNHNAGWQILGELELPASASLEDALQEWLKEILHPLNLQVELLNKITLSAQGAMERFTQAKVVNEFEHIHLIVFVPSEREEKEQAWGFFRLEKIEDAKDGQAVSNHAVEFYIYGEGD